MPLLPWLVAALGAMPADVRPVRVEVQCGLERCPTVTDVRRRLSAALGYDAIDPRAERRVVVRFDPAGEGVGTELELYDGGRSAGARRFETAVVDWAAVLGATVINIALVVEPGRLDLLAMQASPAPAEPPPQASPAQEPPAAVPPPAPPPEAPPPVEPPPEDPPPEEPPVPPAPAYGLALVAGLGPAYGLTPAVTPQLRLGARMRWSALSTELTVRYDVQSATDFVTGEVVADLLAADVAGCLHVGRFAGCATGLVGAQRASSVGLPGPRAVVVPVLAVGARGQVAFPLREGLALRLDLDVRAALSRTRLRVDGNLAWQNETVAVDGLASIVWGF